MLYQCDLNLLIIKRYKYRYACMEKLSQIRHLYGKQDYNN